MAGGLVQSEQQGALDNRFPTTGASDYVMYSENGTTESAKVARHAIGATGWAAATAATPSVKANNAALTSPAASGAGNISHYCIGTSGGVARTDWAPINGGTPIPVIVGSTIGWAIGALQVTLD